VKCPFCHHLEDRVIDSRENRDGNSIRRRRECLSCGKRFTTYERIGDISLIVVKKDGRREPFIREKLLSGVRSACEKRPISQEQMRGLADEVESFMLEHSDREVPTREIGELIMMKLQKMDKVAFVRFASVYREFKDVSEFLQEINELSDSKPGETRYGKSTKKR
jgi:transcriptional repressor NrdR